MAERERLSLFGTPEATERLRQIALEFGFVITVGAGRGRGSVSAFMEAIAEGQVQVTREQLLGRELDDALLRRIVTASVDATLQNRLSSVLSLEAETKPEPATVT